ncbi:MAG TPA: Stk1 family PASTA domain-containing Ser/Thr kinase [Pseudonocardiaceae bacterium]|jgi:serine/threonine-protein kinase|nr:Stk1 family PASTA domain-containing Ser/Thr kinase [Pseudonocardiaceae bacterium]
MSTPRLLSNRYELGDTIGYGGMSEVHKGRDVRLSRDVAIKVLRADLARDPQFQERFRREAQNAAALNHPAIVAVYDTGETTTEFGPLPYIVMEFVDGRTLRDIVKTEGPLPSKRAMEVMADVCAALDFSHRHGIVHRDVKPANVMITRTGAVKVMDFGIARAVADGQAQMTQTAAVIGTAQYLSPEQARGESVDARSDVYAAGCVLFELLTGEPPFTGDSPVAVAYQHVREDPKPPSSLNPRVNPALDAIVLKAMAKGPANRYQSAAEMRGDLVRVLSGQRPSAPQVMTDEDRTSIMGAGRTEVMGGRHRPDVLDPDYDDYDPDEEDRRARRKRAWIIGSIVAAIVILIALAIWLIPKLGSGNNTATQVTVPGLQGQTQTQAEQALSQVHLTWTIHSISCVPGPNGQPAPCQPDQVNKVISSTPNSGTPVPVNSQVTLNIGTAPTTINNLPDLSGLTVQQATQKLQSLGLQLAESPNTDTTLDSSKVNTVVPNSQTPAAGSTVSANSTVTVTLYAAPQQIQVNDVTGQMYDQAAQNLQGQGFKVKKVMEANADPANTVESEDPPGGSVQPKGTVITLTVSDGSLATFTMPDLSGETVSQATSQLQGLGWTGSFNQVATPPTSIGDQVGTIADQEQGQGTQVQKGATIGITVYSLTGTGTPPTSGNSGAPPTYHFGPGGNVPTTTDGKLS